MSTSPFYQARLLGYKVVELGHDALREISQKVPKEELGTRDLIQFIEYMHQTLDSTKGVGLAAPQVGVNIELFVTKIPKRCEDRYILCKRSDFQVWINPTYKIVDSEKLGGIEACLSIPGFVGRVMRPKAIKVKALDQNGQILTDELNGWNARIFLHEYDHLKGILYIDKSILQSSDYKGLYKKDFWDSLEEKKRREHDREWLENHGLLVISDV